MSASLKPVNPSLLLPSTKNTQTLTPEEPDLARRGVPPSLREGITPDRRDTHVIIHRDTHYAAPPSLPRALQSPDSEAAMVNVSQGEYYLSFGKFVSIFLKLEHVVKNSERILLCLISQSQSIAIKVKNNTKQVRNKS